MSIMLCRHGRTEWNKQLKIQGSLNSPLLQESKAELPMLKKYVWHCDRFYCSELERAFESANIAGLDVTTVPELNEIDHGDYEGKYALDIKELYKRIPRDWNLRWPNGESYNDVKDRVGRFLRRLDDSEEVFIMAHEVINKVALHILLGTDEIEAGQVRQPNNFIYRIDDGATAIDYTTGREYKGMVFRTY